MTPEELTTIASEADEAARTARARLVEAVRTAHASGLTQTEIALASGGSQPEMSRLVRVHGSGRLDLRLREHRRPVLDLITASGGSNVRVFGSVATGRERPGSDIDLLYTAGPGTSLLTLSRLEIELAEELGASVDLVPDDAIRPSMRDQILSEAVSL